jgi:hypothetical protein
VDVPPSIGPVVFGVGVGWVTIRCPRQYDELMRRAGGVWYRPERIVVAAMHRAQLSVWLPRRNCTTNQRFGLGATGAVLQRDGDRNGVA